MRKSSVGIAITMQNIDIKCLKIVIGFIFAFGIGGRRRLQESHTQTPFLQNLAREYQTRRISDIVMIEKSASRVLRLSVSEIRGLMNEMSVLGITKPDVISELLGTGFLRFSSLTGINGLAKIISEGRLDILAVDATNPGTGQFRSFIEQAKREFATICLWEIWNPILAEILQRYGFQAYIGIDKNTGEILNGYRYDGGDDE